MTTSGHKIMSNENDRMIQAVVILASPWNYKICEGCDSIVTQQTSICPNCKSYRFNEDVDILIDHVKKLVKTEQQTVTEEELFS